MLLKNYTLAVCALLFSPMVTAGTLAHWSKQTGMDIAKSGQKVSAAENIYNIHAPELAEFVSVKKERSTYIFATYQSFSSASECFTYMDAVMIPEVKEVVGDGLFAESKEKGNHEKRLLIKKNPKGTSFAIMCGTEEMKVTLLGKYADQIVSQYRDEGHKFWGGLLLRLVD